jgi:endonuclease/exonuclease/phosphatase family metal-dependent hydrolase
VEAVCHTAIGAVRVVATHLGLGPRNRRVQAAFLASMIGQSGVPVIVLGDFNDWRRNGPVDAALREHLPVRVSAPTWPARWPLAPFDRLYASLSLQVLRREVPDWMTHASDHLPLAVDIVRAEMC